MRPTPSLPWLIRDEHFSWLEARDQGNNLTSRCSGYCLAIWIGLRQINMNLLG